MKKKDFEKKISILKLKKKIKQYTAPNPNSVIVSPLNKMDQWKKPQKPTKTIYLNNTNSNTISPKIIATPTASTTTSTYPTRRKYKK